MDTNPSHTNQTTQHLQLVSFTVGSEVFAVDILCVKEIIRLRALTKVPMSPEGIEGVLNLRGRVIPVLDMRTQFGIPATQASDESRIVVVVVQGNTVGCIVDSVHEVLTIDRSVIEDTPTIATSVDSSYVSGVAKLDDQLIILLDLNYVLSAQSLDKLVVMGTQIDNAGSGTAA